MRRSRTVDWLLLATLLPLYVAIQAVGIHEYRKHEGWWFAFSPTGAQGADGYPIVERLNTLDCPLRVGDRLLRVGGTDVRGFSRAETRHLQEPLLSDGLPYPVEIERDGERLVLMVSPVPHPYWWIRILGGMSVAVAGALLLIRAPHWHLSRRYFFAALLVGSYGALDLGQLKWLWSPFLAVGLALLLWSAWEWTEAARPLRRWQKLLPWVFGVLLLAELLLHMVLTPPAGFWPSRLVMGTTAAVLFLTLAALARAYRRSGPLERRQLRWVLYGITVAVLSNAVQSGTTALGIEKNYLVWEAVVAATGAAVPLGIVISIIGYGWLDIDRVISASAAATLVGVALVGGLLAVVPPVASAASTTLGIDPETGRLLLSMALAAVLVPVYRALRPWLDRRLFAEQHALAGRFEKLRAELGAVRGVEEMATRAGEGFDALLKPESVAIYGRAGEAAFTPLFLRGRALPPAFEASGMLVQVLEARGKPLFARSKELGPFERATLETLGAEVVVPQLREKQLVAFTCLGGKRSGDIYTGSDLALLASLAERCGEVIARIDAETLATEAQAMQSALRRYVPGAVADRLLAGDALEPAERDVTVLFVDIRGYTGVAERLAAKDVFATLNEHTERVSRMVQESGGTIVEFNGDGMMAVFGAPEALAKKEQSAVEAGRRIVDSMPDDLAVGVGVATGTAFVGSIRSTDRLIWSAVGSTTNLASRLQSLTRELGASIAIDETTRERAGYVCADFVRHEGVAIRGRLGRFDVFALPLR